MSAYDNIRKAIETALAPNIEEIRNDTTMIRADITVMKNQLTAINDQLDDLIDRLDLHKQIDKLRRKAEQPKAN